MKRMNPEVSENLVRRLFGVLRAPAPKEEEVCIDCYRDGGCRDHSRPDRGENERREFACRDCGTRTTAIVGMAADRYELCDGCYWKRVASPDREENER